MDSDVLQNTSPKRVESSAPRAPGPAKRARIAEEDRKRAARACDGCRRLKEKCEGGVPCIRCIRTGRNCEFNNELPRQRPTTLGNPESDERIKYLEQIATHFLGDVSLSLPSLRAIAEKIQTSPSRVESDPDHVSSELEDLTLEDEKFVVKTLSHNTAHYSGEFSHWNFSQKVRKRVDECLVDGIGEDISKNYKKRGVNEHWRATQLQSPASAIFAVLQSLPPQHVLEFLVQIYFQYAQVNVFFIEEKWLRERLRVIHENPLDIKSDDAGWICSVLMVLAIGTQFAHMESGPSPIEEPVENGSPPSEQDVGVTFYHMACKLIPDVITIASLESVQACLLLAHYALPLDTQGLAYTYLGLAVKVAIQNGMHRKYTGKDFAADTVETRNRLWWTAFTLEKRICILHGRPPSVSPHDVDADLPVDLPDFRSPTHPSTFPNMSALIYLTCRLGDISNAITLLRRCPKRLQPTYFDRIFELRSQLTSWWSTLPTSVVCRDLTPGSPLFRHNAHLKLCFHLSEIFMGRPFIFFAEGKSPSPRSDLGAKVSYSNAKSPHRRPKNNRATLVADAESAALSIIELCALLDKHCGLARASYTEFSSCRAALLVILAQCLNGQTEVLRNALATGMKLIKKMAVSIDSAKSELSVIEALETAIKRLDMSGDAFVEEEKGKETGYEKFRNWAALWRGVQWDNNFAPANPLLPLALPDTPSTWLNAFDGQSVGLDQPSNGSVGGDDLLSDYGMGSFPMLDEQWQVDFGVLDGFETRQDSSQK